MDGRLKPHKRKSLEFSGIHPNEKYDELSWAGLCKFMAQAFREGSGPLYDFFKKNLEVAFDKHGVKISIWTIHNDCGAYGIPIPIEELLSQLEDVITVYEFINARWPDVEFKITRQQLSDSEGADIALSKMTVEEAREMIEELRRYLV